MNPTFWQGRRVFVTGHTGFKGSWLALWLQRLGASVAGYALDAPTEPNLFALADVAEGMASYHGDICDLATLRSALVEQRPEVVIHLAAQPIVGVSYQDPLGTLRSNVLGTATLLEAAREVSSVRALVTITSDKCYANREWVWGYRETDRLGGRDPYSASKACAEHVIEAFRHSYFPTDRWHRHRVAVASTRAGNVLGGGDWSPARLVPDVLSGLADGRAVDLRNPAATRPWQHVLEPLAGYLILAERLAEEGPNYAEAWNFGPDEEAIRPVRWVVEALHRLWEGEASWRADRRPYPYESTLLKLDSSKARARLNWRPRLSLEDGLEWIVAWHKAYLGGLDMRAFTLGQIGEYEALLTPTREASTRGM